MAIKKTQYRFTTKIRFKEKDFIQLLVTCNTFPCFLNNPNWSVYPNCSQNFVLHRSWKALKNFLKWIWCTIFAMEKKIKQCKATNVQFQFFLATFHVYVEWKLSARGFITFLCRRSVGFFCLAFWVFLMKESKKRRRKQPGKLMAKSRSQPVNLPGTWPLMNHLICVIDILASERRNRWLHVH